MPTSEHYNISPALSVILGLQPASVLNVGCGFGKYGVLLREYLDLWHGRVDPGTWQARIEAVEAFAQYRSPIWDYVYNRVHLGDVRDVLPGLGRFDVILIADMIEHLEKPAASALVKQCLTQCDTLLITTPKEFYPQEESNKNPYERHLCLWTDEDYPSGTDVITIPEVGCNIYVASSKPLARNRMAPAALPDVAFLQSRVKLKKWGTLGWPASAGLRTICRWMT